MRSVDTGRPIHCELVVGNLGNRAWRQNVENAAYHVVVITIICEVVPYNAAARFDHSKGRFCIIAYCGVMMRTIHEHKARLPIVRGEVEPGRVSEGTA